MSSATKPNKRRTDAPEKRRKLMEAWADYYEPNGSDNILQIGKRKGGPIYPSACRSILNASGTGEALKSEIGAMSSRRRRGRAHH